MYLARLLIFILKIMLFEIVPNLQLNPSFCLLQTVPNLQLYLFLHLNMFLDSNVLANHIFICEFSLQQWAVSYGLIY